MQVVSVMTAPLGSKRIACPVANCSVPPSALRLLSRDRAWGAASARATNSVEQRIRRARAGLEGMNHGRPVGPRLLKAMAKQEEGRPSRWKDGLARSLVHGSFNPCGEQGVERPAHLRREWGGFSYCSLPTPLGRGHAACHGWRGRSVGLSAPGAIGSRCGADVLRGT